MVVLIGSLNAANAVLTTYLNAVIGLCVFVLLVLVFLTRRWRRTSFRRRFDDVLPVHPPAHLDDAPYNALSKSKHIPERVLSFDTADSEDELRLHIHQDKESVACRYEEKNENAPMPSETVIETALRETRIDNVSPPLSPPGASAYLRTLEQQSSIESDIIAHNDTSLLCAGGSGETACGTLEVSVLYDAPVRSLTLHVLQARTLPNKHNTPNMQSQSQVCNMSVLYDAPVRSLTLHVLQARTLPNKHNTPNMQSQVCNMSVLYDAPVRSLTLHVLQARMLPNMIDSDEDNSMKVRVVLLPMKKQKYKTKIRYGENPQFMESFVFHKINPEDVHGLSLRIRSYGCERMRRQRLIGEAILSFSALNLECENNLWLLLAPRHHTSAMQTSQESRGSISGVASPMSPICVTTASLTTSASVIGGDVISLARSDSASSCCSARAAPELLLGLAYSPTTGHLSVEVIKGTHFRKLSPQRAPDTYVKLCLVSSLGLEMGRCKSSTRRAHSNPLYKELFIFQVALFQLSEVTLMVSVWWRRSVKRNEMVGWFSLGLNSSGKEEARHWRDVCDARGEQVQRWHLLIDS